MKNFLERISFDQIFQLQDLKNSFIEIQTEFQLQVKSLRADLEEEKQARVKLEAEVSLGGKSSQDSFNLFLFRSEL